jgi:uncharacterized protein YndB with AHSA1/START domain
MKTLLVSLLITAAHLCAQTSANSPSAQPATGRVLTIAVTIPAPRSEVWHAFATSEGLSTWLTPGAVGDLRPGGEWTAHFPGGKTGGGTIVSFIPETELVLSAMAPEQFPTVRATRTRARFRFESRGQYTLLELEQTGWQNGEEWNQAYEYLVAGNAQLLAQLHRRFVNGPIDWAKEWGIPPKEKGKTQ